MFQPGFNATTEDHLGWDEFGYGDILATMDAPQHVEEVGLSQLTQALPVGTQPTHPVGGTTPVAGGATPASAGSSLAGRGTPAGGATPPAEGHRMLQARRRRPWRHRLPTSSDRGWSGHLTPGRMAGPHLG
jgi:hypothetical protein